MKYEIGTKLISKMSGLRHEVIGSDDASVTVKVVNSDAKSEFRIDEVSRYFVVEEAPRTVTEALSALDTQVDGDHYKKLGDYQPWEVLRRWLTPEEFRGYMKGTAIAYLARERDKGGLVDIEKAAHTLRGLIELGETE
jgi:hypothetical protein